MLPDVYPLKGRKSDRSISFSVSFIRSLIKMLDIEGEKDKMVNKRLRERLWTVLQDFFNKRKI